MATRRKGYGQFCPVAKAAEIVAERWTPLILREMICGSHRFNDLRKGVPLMSPSLLSRRLQELEDAGVVERRTGSEGNRLEYHLTPAGRELKPVIEMLGLWGHRWAQREIRQEDLDPLLLMWDIRRCVDSRALPSDRRIVIQFDLAGVPSKRSLWWLVRDRGDVDLCLKSPGYDVDLYVAAHIRTLVDVRLGNVDLRAALRSESIQLKGPRSMVEAFERWFGPGVFARLSQETAKSAS